MLLNPPSLNEMKIDNIHLYIAVQCMCVCVGGGGFCDHQDPAPWIRP